MYAKQTKKCMKWFDKGHCATKIVTYRLNRRKGSLIETLNNNNLFFCNSWYNRYVFLCNCGGGIF